jgi:ligand-binding SRPBCC domain-containing protein
MVFEASLWLPAARDEVFGFFSDAANLEALTPAWLKFHIATPQPILIRTGTTIDYRLRVHGVPMRWQSEITRWEPPTRFVDEQRIGPYRRWIHTHTFDEERGGTRVGDKVDFAVPGGKPIEWIVARDVRRIFAFRREMLLKRFG